jgi:hypothetical protein
MSTRPHVITRRAPLVSIAVALIASACGSSSIAVTGPTTPKCQVSATNSLASVPADGATGTITIDTTRDCTWTASSGASWIALTSEAAGQGSGSVAYRVAANADPSARRAMVDVNDAQVVVAQDPGVCRFTVASPDPTVSAAGGPLTVTVTASAAACTWTAASSVAWIGMTKQSATAGNGTATFTVGQNAGDARIGAITVAGQTITVTQAAAASTPPPVVPPNPSTPCAYALSSASQTIAAEGGSQQVGVTAPTGCAWTAVSNASWITVTGGASGTGNGQVAYAAAANAGAVRTGTLTIAGVTLTVTQPAAACGFAIAPSSQAVPAAGGTGSVAVTARGDCSWSASSNADWLMISSGASGTGNGTVGFSAAANPTSAARIGTLTIAGQTFTVTEAAPPAPCTYSIAPAAQTIDANGGVTSVSVTAGAGCAWTAVSSADWLAVSPPASGTGNGTISIVVARNPGASRVGTVTIVDQTFTVTQASEDHRSGGFF